MPDNLQTRTASILPEIIPDDSASQEWKQAESNILGWGTAVKQNLKLQQSIRESLEFTAFRERICLLEQRKHGLLDLMRELKDKDENNIRDEQIKSELLAETINEYRTAIHDFNNTKFRAKVCSSLDDV